MKYLFNINPNFAIMQNKSMKQEYDSGWIMWQKNRKKKDIKILQTFFREKFF